MDTAHDIACVILAGGQGKRMGSADLHKVCFPVDGTPAIVRAIEAYKAAGLTRLLVVVGQKAEQVIRTVSDAHAEVTFVHQAEPRGTGHAAAVAVGALAAQGGCSGALVTMGDKLVAPSVVSSLVERFRKSGADVVMATLPKGPATSSGRIVEGRDGAVLAVVERPDIDRARAAGSTIRLAGRRLTADQIEKRSPTVNPSMYLFRFDRLVEALGRLGTDNAQGEMYLTDTIGLIAAAGRVETMPLADPHDLMGFNTPEELLAIEEAFRRRQAPRRVSLSPRKRLTARVLKPAGRWLAIAEGDSASWRRTLRRTYGADEALHADRRRAARRVVTAFIRRYGPDRPMVLCRAPGRVNLMGRHVDHRGAHVNVMALGREVLLAAGRRDDDLVTLANVQAREFPSRSFRIADLLRKASWDSWLDFVDSRAVRTFLDEAPGDWSNYARAAMLRLQHESRHERLAGMDCVVAGNIPMGAGLSSSSALVVAFAEAAVGLNRLDVTLQDFVDLCGEGEWFVGSRGGSADHAAIRAGRIGRLRRIGFFPFRLAGEMPFPSRLRVVIAHSGSQAVKSQAARHVFNQRVACYQIAEMLLRRSWPPAAAAEHLRDLTPTRLGVAPAEIYRAVMRLPDRPSRAALRELLGGEFRDRLDRIFTTHTHRGRYDLRGVTLYGLGETERSERFADVLRAGDLELLGRWIRTSHDGDRVVRRGPDGRPRRFLVRTDDATLQRLADADVDLADQPGRYACSTESVDHLVDVASAADGVVGAQLAGAGLGGCMMIVVGESAVEPLMRKLRREFYRPRKLKFAAFTCSPVAGAGLIGV